MDPEPGLRERKRQQTRQMIATTAFDLFTKRGFDAVTVGEVARHAEFSEATVFNYFPTKEDLVFAGLETFDAEVLEAIRDRDPEHSIPAAYRAYVLQPGGLVAATDPDSSRQLVTVAKMIAGSRSLRSRERQMQDDFTCSLARLIAEEMSAKRDDIQPWVIANALTGVHRALIEHVRSRALAGDSGARLGRRIRVQADRAFGTLERGLANYPSSQDLPATPVPISRPARARAQGS
jgi:AcrR family transcriptional regulator